MEEFVKKNSPEQLLELQIESMLADMSFKAEEAIERIKKTGDPFLRKNWIAQAKERIDSTLKSKTDEIYLMLWSEERVELKKYNIEQIQKDFNDWLKERVKDFESN